jgi:Domain of unknown function (DUF4157)
MPGLAAPGLAPSRIPAGASFPSAATIWRKPLARPSQIPVGSGGKDGADGPRYTSPVLDVVGKGTGQPLGPKVRADMEARLGSDFSDVRVHASPQATEAAEAVDAQAFTVGNNVVFGDGRYDVSSTPGRKLLAHELAHVVQQKHQEPSPDTVEIAAADSPFEHQAEIASKGDFSGHLALAHLSGSAVLQRAPQKTDPPARKSELAALDKRMQALERRQSATTQDLHWRGLFGEKLSSWKQAVYRVAGGIDNARSGFTDAQVKQADFDALVTQIFLAIATVGFAAGFEPLLTGALMTSKIGGEVAGLEIKVKRIADIVEKVENPAVSAVSSQANIVGAIPRRDTSPSTTPEVQASTGLAFLSERLEVLESYSQRIEHAFVVRSEELAKLSDDVAATLDTAKQEGIYADLMNSLDRAADGIEKMKPPAKVAIVLERHMWAAWLKENYLPASVDDLGYNAPTFRHFGNYIEDRLNEVGISDLARVELTGHWYSSDSSGYANALLLWAWWLYRGSIRVGGPD